MKGEPRCMRHCGRQFHGLSGGRLHHRSHIGRARDKLRAPVVPFAKQVPPGNADAGHIAEIDDQHAAIDRR